MKHMRFLSLMVMIAMLLPTAGLAEELGEMDLYAPEIYQGEYVEEEPTPAEPTAAEPTPAEPIAAEPTAAEPTPAEPTDAEPMAVDAPVMAEGASTEGTAAEGTSTEGTAPAATAQVQTVALTGAKAAAQMNVEETLQIAVNEGEKGTFTSRSAKLATVDENGLVTALAKGTAKIEFKPEGGKKRTLSVRIVNPFEPTGVSVAQGKSITMNVDDTLQLDAVLAPETARTALTWKSSRAKVAAVDGSGLVTALKEGKTKLTVTTANRKRATIAVTVVDPYKPTGVSIGQGGAVTLNVGDTLQLDAVLAPETARSALTWKISRAKVASVDGSGLVTALMEGKTKLTVTTANRKKATIAVTVVNAFKPTGVSINQGKALTLKTGESAQLDATVAPDTARTVLTWKSSRTKVATVDANGCVTALAAGKAKITVKTDSGISDALELQVIEVVEPPRSPAMNTATYNGVEFRVINTAVDPIAYAPLVYDSICTHPRGTDKYSGYCLGFCHYYASCMVDNITAVDVGVARRRYRTTRKLNYSTEMYANPDAMMARLFDLLNTGAPQILMVEAITHPGYRHFVTVVGYRSSVTRREDLRPEDLLIIDSFDGKLESMDPAIEPKDARVLFKQNGKYRIEALTYRG